MPCARTILYSARLEITTWVDLDLDAVVPERFPDYHAISTWAASSRVAWQADVGWRRVVEWCRWQVVDSRTLGWLGDQVEMLSERAGISGSSMSWVPGRLPETIGKVSFAPQFWNHLQKPACGKMLRPPAEGDPPGENVLEKDGACILLCKKGCKV
jgi:hypothetical protein